MVFRVPITRIVLLCLCQTFHAVTIVFTKCCGSVCRGSVLCIIVLWFTVSYCGGCLCCEFTMSWFTVLRLIMLCFTVLWFTVSWLTVSWLPCRGCTSQTLLSKVPQNSDYPFRTAKSGVEIRSNYRMQGHFGPPVLHVSKSFEETKHNTIGTFMIQ